MRNPVRILAVIPSRADVDRVLAGWDSAMKSPDGITWILERIEQYESGVDSGSDD
ncbi:MAG: hypothetical protein U0V73_06805 [Acidimicrobiia bacterium]